MNNLPFTWRLGILAWCSFWAIILGMVLTGCTTMAPRSENPWPDLAELTAQDHALRRPVYGAPAPPVYGCVPRHQEPDYQVDTCI